MPTILDDIVEIWRLTARFVVLFVIGGIPVWVFLVGLYWVLELP